jgi:hypothetical protein
VWCSNIKDINSQCLALTSGRKKRKNKLQEAWRCGGCWGSVLSLCADAVNRFSHRAWRAVYGNRQWLSVRTDSGCLCSRCGSHGLLRIENLGRLNPADTCCAIFCCLYKSAFENPWEKARETASASDVSSCRKGGCVAPSCAVTVVLCGGRVYIFACASIHGSLKCCGCELKVGNRETGGGGYGLRVVYLVGKV